MINTLLQANVIPVSLKIQNQMNIEWDKTR